MTDRIWSRMSVFGLAALASCGVAATPKTPPLILERTIPLPDVRGRIDHLAIDLKRNRLFVAELGNGSVDAVDLGRGRIVGRISGLKEPQGVAYLPDRDELAVASGGDGTVRFYRGSDIASVGVVTVGDDADNLHVDPTGERLVVGYGAGALALIDPKARTILIRVLLPGHPEGFALSGGRIIVNIPDRALIAAADLRSGRMTARWPAAHSANFPLALDSRSGLVAVVYRSPARLVTLDSSTGRTLSDVETCGDADDVFFDTARHRLLVSCGSGGVQMFNATTAGSSSLGFSPTRSGARTSLFVPEQDHLYVAARASGGRGAEILVYRLGS